MFDTTISAIEDSENNKLLIKKISNDEQFVELINILLDNLLDTKKYKKVDISRCSITTLEPLSTVDHLESLYIYFEPNISNQDLAFISKMKELRILNLWNAGLTSLDYLPSLERLEEVTLYGSNINDFSPFSRLPNLKKLSLFHAPLNRHTIDLTTLRKCLSLQSIELDPLDINNLKGEKNISALNTILARNVELAEAKTLMERINIYNKYAPVLGLSLLPLPTLKDICLDHVSSRVSTYSPFFSCLPSEVREEIGMTSFQKFVSEHDKRDVNANTNQESPTKCNRIA